MARFQTIPEGEARDASWRMADGGGAQVFRLRRVSYGFVAQGVVHAEEDGAGYGLTVTLAMGRDWVLRMARLRAQKPA